MLARSSPISIGEEFYSTPKSCLQSKAPQNIAIKNSPAKG